MDLAALGGGSFGLFLWAIPSPGGSLRFWRKPLDAETQKPPRGHVFLLPNQCKGCGFCVEFCPLHVLALSSDYNAKGYHPVEVVNPQQCVDCDLCEILCPDFAIFCLSENEPGRTWAAASAREVPVGR